MSAHLKLLTPERSAVHRFGALLRGLRIEAGFSQPELSARLYTSKSTLSRAETGVRLLARDLVEACDELLGAAGTLLAEWLNAGSARVLDSPGDRPPRPTSARKRTLIPHLYRLALRTSGAGSALGSDVQPSPKARRVEVLLAVARAVQGRRERDRPQSPGRAKHGRYPLPLLGVALPVPPPAGAVPREATRSRPWVRGPAPSGSAGGGSPDSSSVLVRFPGARSVHVAVGRV